MSKILFINTVSGYNATGNITADLASIKEYDTLICYGRKRNYRSEVKSVKICNLIDSCVGAFKTIAFGDNTNICTESANRLIKVIQEYKPDIIHLHNIHGYYLNVETLFLFLRKYNKPVIWTFHDCWPITGYCPNFDYAKCDKFKTKCFNCNHRFSYPFSLFKQRVEKEYEIKKQLFNSVNLTIVTPSNWLKKQVETSVLKNQKTLVINNGIRIVESNYDRKKNFGILAVASVWTNEKGLDELRKIVPLIDKRIEITIVGKLRNKKGLENCKLIERTTDYFELIKYYSENHLFINPTLEDNYPTVNLESLSCGTPIITYNTGGSPETITKDNGIVIEKGDYISFANAINSLVDNYYFDSQKIKKDAKKFDKKFMLEKYKKLYEDVLLESKNLK